MQDLAKISTSILLSFLIALIVSPLIIKFTRKIKFNQPVYEYVELHKKKNGTPTMGGLIFLIAITVSTLILCKGKNSLVLISIFVMLGYGLIGFLDDYLKIKLKHNEGLKPYQKIIAQLIIATIVSVFAFKSPLVMGEIYIPFTNKIINLGFWFIPLSIIFFLAITNSVNLTDGLDGLAGGVSLIYQICFLIVFIILFYSLGKTDFLIGSEYKSLIILISSSIGGLLGYLLFNSHPALIFMGDTGSLGLGGLLGVVALFSKTMLYVPFLGIMFVVSSVSVIIQVLHYKRTRKRIFLMAPFHHHLEQKSMYETKIVVIYMVITAILGLMTILLTLALT